MHNLTLSRALFLAVAITFLLNINFMSFETKTSASEINGETAAIDRHDTSRMTCAQVTATLQSERKAILRYPSSRVPGLIRYDKYVPDRNACSAGQLPIMSNVPTTDTKSCSVPMRGVAAVDVAILVVQF